MPFCNGHFFTHILTYAFLLTPLLVNQLPIVNSSIMKNTSEVTSALFLEEKAQGSELSTEYAIYCSFTGKPVKLRY